MARSNKWTPLRLAQALRLRREGLTLQELGEHYGVGRERARQVIAKAERMDQAGRLPHLQPWITSG